MTALRRHLRDRSLAALWLLVVALLVRGVVPAGYMIGPSASGAPTMMLCSGYAPSGGMAMTTAMPGMMHHAGKEGHGKAETPCAFSGLTAPSLGAADPIQPMPPSSIAADAVPRTGRLLALERPAFLRPHPTGPPAA